MLHETAVSWMRTRLTQSTPQQPWLETVEEYGGRLRSCCEMINKDLNVDGLCRAFMTRINKMREREGGRLKE